MVRTITRSAMVVAIALSIFAAQSRAEILNLAVDGGLSFPVGALNDQFKIGWDVGASVFGWPYRDDIGMGLQFSYNRWTADPSGFTLHVGPSGIRGTSSDANGHAWLVDVEPAVRFAFPYRNQYLSGFFQAGVGWFHFSTDAVASGTLAETPVSEDFSKTIDGVSTSAGVGVTFGAYKSIGIELVPLFHFDLSNNKPITFFTTNIAISIGI